MYFADTSTYINSPKGLIFLSYTDLHYRIDPIHLLMSWLLSYLALFGMLKSVTLILVLQLSVVSAYFSMLKYAKPLFLLGLAHQITQAIVQLLLSKAHIS